MNDLTEEFETEIIDLMNAYGKEAFHAGFIKGGIHAITKRRISTVGELKAAYQEWVEANE